MQKVLSFFIIFILSFSPMINASASQLTCKNMMSDSVSDNMSPMIDMTSDMSSTHDCCDTPSLICDHAGACDCDNTQVNYSVIPALAIHQAPYLISLKHLYSQPTFLSKSTESLYRPPINIFI